MLCAKFLKMLANNDITWRLFFFYICMRVYMRYPGYVKKRNKKKRLARVRHKKWCNQSRFIAQCPHSLSISCSIVSVVTASLFRFISQLAIYWTKRDIFASIFLRFTFLCAPHKWHCWKIVPSMLGDGKKLFFFLVCWLCFCTTKLYVYAPHTLYD